MNKINLINEKFLGNKKYKEYADRYLYLMNRKRKFEKVYAWRLIAIDSDFSNLCTEFSNLGTEFSNLGSEFSKLCTNFSNLGTDFSNLYTEFSNLCTDFSKFKKLNSTFL